MATDKRQPVGGNTPQLSAEEIERKAVDAAVAEVFAMLGVDVRRPESIEEFREDLRFGRRMRRATGHGELVFVAIMIGAVLTALWAGVKQKLLGEA
jgi:hypothetical protein